MWAKEMFLEKINKKKIIKLYLIVFIALFSFSVKCNEEEYLNNVANYLTKINEFSSSFLQIQNNEISEGLISIKKKRLRIEYMSPSKLVFILKKNKAMFFNKDLQEVEYFNPKKTAGQFLLDLFNEEKFLSDAKVIKGNGYFYLLKKIYIDEDLNEVEIYFEENPLHLRKIEIINGAGITSFTINNPNFNPNLNDKLFSLANPLL